MTLSKRGFVITGSTGFIGQAVIRRLQAQFGEDVDIIALDSSCNLEDAKGAFEVFHELSTRVRPDHVLHFAARAPSGVWLANNPADAYYRNTLMNANLFEGCRRYFPQAQITTTLSYSIYPPSDTACTEDELSLDHREDNLAAYAATKTAILTAQNAYFQQYGLRAFSVVLPTVYGFHGRDQEFGRVIPSLCKKFLDGVETGASEVELWGNGDQERDYLYVDDAADGIIASALLQTSPLLNLGSAHVYPIREVATLIAKFTGYSGRITYDQTRYTGPDRRWLSADKAQSELGWSASTSLEDGLKSTINKMKRHREANEVGNKHH